MTTGHDELLWVVGVPGIREYWPGADDEPARAKRQQRREEQWRAALQGAVDRRARFGGIRRQVRVRVVLYAAELERAGLARWRVPVAQGVVREIHEGDPQWVRSTLQPTVEELLKELTGRKTVRDALEAWARTAGLDSPGAALRYAQTHLADIGAYLSCREHLACLGPAPDRGPVPGCGPCARRRTIRDAVVQAVRDADGQGTPAEVVIGRDLGAIIAYEALCQLSRQDAEVPLLLTLGGPLALRSVRDRLDPPPWGGAGVRPPRLSRWIDVGARTDVLRCQVPDGDEATSCWFAEVVDRVVDDGVGDHHRDDAYLDCDAVGETLGERARTIEIPSGHAGVADLRGS